MSLLHKTKNQQKNNDPIIRLITPMIAGMLACIFCLVSMTWAWFTASVDTPTQTIQSANRSTSVKVYEISQAEDENRNVTKTLIKPQISEGISLAEDTQTDANEGTIIAGETAVWELAPEKTYEVVMTGSGTASTGYCKIALSHTTSEKNTPETKLYQTSNFEKEHTVRFTYNTGGFSDAEGVTATQYMEYVEKTAAPTLAIASYWGKPAEESEPQVALMSLRGSAEEEIMLLADGDVLGLAPIPCPEAKAETEVELEGFEIQEGTEISAEEDYKVSLTLKEGYEMPSEVVVNIDGKDYVVSTQSAEASDDAPYYDTQTGVLTVPSALLSDGIKVSVKATATPIPEEEPEEEETKEEVTEETTEEETTEEKADETTKEITDNTTEDTSKEITDKTETTDDNETEENNSADTSSNNNVAIDNPNKKEDDGEEDNDEPVKTPAGDGGNDDDDDEADNNSGSSSSGNSSSSGSSSSSGNNKEETEEKADVTLNLSQLTINLEETQIPTNADLVLTLSAKEDMELPKQIVITLDKTIRDENIEDEEIEEDKTEYIINTDGKDNPEGFEFDAETGELTISSELLENVREITIADTEENEADEDDEKATLTFEVKNLTFDFTDDEIATDEDVVITFTAGEGYELPETIIITIDGVEYIIYTSEEDSDKNPDGITFDIETGTLTISKDLLKDAEAITIAAEGVKKEDEESNEENPDADKKDESEDKDNTAKENEAEGGDATDKKPEGGTDTPDAEDKTEPESGTNDSNGANTGTTTPETNPDNTTDDNVKDVIKGEDEDTTETPEPGTEPTTPTTPGTEDNTDAEQGGEKVETEGNGEGSTENGTEETIPDTEGNVDDETTIPTEPTTPAEPSEAAVSPETPKTETPGTSEPTTGGNDDGNGETESADSSSTESSNSGNDSTDSGALSESTTSTTPSVTPSAPTTSAPASSETSTPSASTQASSNTSSTSASSTPSPSTNSNTNGASQSSGATTPSGSKETSSEE